MVTIKETAREDIKNVQRLWADGDVMRFVGFPDGLHETDEAMQQWLEGLNAARPTENHFSIYENGKYCGEAGYGLDKEHGSGIATQAISYAMEEAFRNGARTVWVDPDPRNVKAIALYERLGFKQKDMPEHVIVLGEDPTINIYFEFCKE